MREPLRLGLVELALVVSVSTEVRWPEKRERRVDEVEVRVSAGGGEGSECLKRGMFARCFGESINVTVRACFSFQLYCKSRYEQEDKVAQEVAVALWHQRSGGSLKGLGSYDVVRQGYNQVSGVESRLLKSLMYDDVANCRSIEGSVHDAPQASTQSQMWLRLWRSSCPVHSLWPFSYSPPNLSV